MFFHIFLAFLLTYLSAFFSGRWGPALPTPIGRSAGEGPALPVDAGAAHGDTKLISRLAVEVWRCSLRYKAGEEEEEGEKREMQCIKSNNPHLTSGEIENETQMAFATGSQPVCL